MSPLSYHYPPPAPQAADTLAWREWTGELRRAERAGRADLPPQFCPLPTASAEAVSAAAGLLRAALEETETP